MRQLRLLLLSFGFALLTLLAFTSFARQAAAAGPPVTPAAIPTPRDSYPVVDTATITRALGFLRTAQRADGGFVGFTPGQSDDFTTIKVALALNAARLPAGYLTTAGGQTPLAYLATRAYSYTHDTSGAVFPGRLGLVALAVVAGDAKLTAFASYPPGHAQAGQPLNLLAALSASYQPTTGAYSSTAQLGFSSGAAGSLSQAYALLGLAAAQQPAPTQAITYLQTLQETDGGWGYGVGGDVDTTALVIQALIANGVAPTDAAIQTGLSFLRGQQLTGGGWGLGGVPSADSTAFVLQALAAVGFTPAKASWASAGGDPLAALGALQVADGSFSGNVLGTAHALAGLTELPLPLLGRVQRAQRALASMRDTQAASGWWGFGAPSVGGTLDVILAFSAAGVNPATVSAAGSSTSALTFLASEVFSYTRDLSGTIFPAQTGKAIVGVVAAGADPTAFGVKPGGGTLNLIDALHSTYVAATGAYTSAAVLGFSSGAATPLSQSFAMLALAAAGQPIPITATHYLRSLQGADGSWVSVDATGLALEALVAAGVSPSDPASARAIAYLRSQQDATGGWGNPNATAYIIQGLVAAGENLAANWLKGGRSPYEALALYQKPDGPFTYTWETDPYFTPGATNDFATWQSVPGLLGVAYPLKPQAGTLVNYTPVARGPNPDRLVAAPPTGRWDGGMRVSVPFGGDLDQNGSVTLAWRLVGATKWTTATLTRAAGVFTATLAVSGPPQNYELQTVLSDRDGVQSGTTQVLTATLTSTVQALRTYLPSVLR